MIAKKKSWFFGWENTKWFIREIRDIWSPKTSYFSKKRIESSVAFIIGQIGMVTYLCENIAKMDTQDIAIWSGIEFGIAGYIVTQIQKEKKAESIESAVVEESISEETNICTNCKQPL